MREILSAIKNFVLTCLIGLFAIVMIVGGAYAVYEVHILQRFLYWMGCIGGTACVLFFAGCMVKELVIDDWKFWSKMAKIDAKGKEHVKA